VPDATRAGAYGMSNPPTATVKLLDPTLLRLDRCVVSDFRSFSSERHA
jgi:hypothetical protein